MFASRAMTALAIDPEIKPARLVFDLLRIEVLLFLADMAGITVLVPELDLDFAGLIRVAYIEVMEPLPAQDVPARRKDENT